MYHFIFFIFSLHIFAFSFISGVDINLIFFFFRQTFAGYFERDDDKDFLKLVIIRWIDIIGPVREIKKGYRYILRVSDYSSRYVITIPMKDQKAHTQDV
jgi:hypothetical protein